MKSAIKTCLAIVLAFAFCSWDVAAQSREDFLAAIYSNLMMKTLCDQGDLKCFMRQMVQTKVTCSIARTFIAENCWNEKSQLCEYARRWLDLGVEIDRFGYAVEGRSDTSELREAALRVEASWKLLVQHSNELSDADKEVLKQLANAKTYSTREDFLRALYFFILISSPCDEKDDIRCTLDTILNMKVVCYFARGFLTGNCERENSQLCKYARRWVDVGQEIERFDVAIRARGGHTDEEAKQQQAVREARQRIQTAYNIVVKHSDDELSKADREVFKRLGEASR
jgi:hypothetical protein